MIRVRYIAKRLVLRRAALPVLFAMVSGACGEGRSVDSAVGPLVPGDSILPPPGPVDTVPPADSTPPPTDSVPPPDTTGTVPYVPVHEGIPFGPWHLPVPLYGPEFSGGYLALNKLDPVGELEAARRTNTRILINLTNSSSKFIDDKGHFSLEKWKQRVDRFKGVDFAPYVADGTLIGHFILDEPQDKSNWGGGTVSQAEIDEMARYSKELWPTMPTVIRAWPAYLKGYNYQYLDAAWAQYLERFGPLDAFIKLHVSDAQAVGLALVTGLNLVGGGGKKEGLKGYHNDRYAMNASQVRTWGSTLLAEPYFCALLSWQYNEAYFARSDIQSALAELSEKARSLPKKTCRK